MALGVVSGLARSIPWGQIAPSVLKWGGRILGLGVGAELLTNGDGKGGIFSKIWRGTSQTVSYETSGTQAVDGLFDSISANSNAITTFLSGTLAQVCDAIAHFTGSPTFAGWAKDLRGYEQRAQDVINQRVQAARENGTDGENGPGRGVIGTLTNSAEKIVPDALDGNNQYVAAAELGALGAGLYGAKKMLGATQPVSISTKVAPLAASNLDLPWNAAKAATVAAEAAPTTSAFGRFMGKMPVVGKYFTAATAIGLGTMGAISYFSSPAEAALHPGDVTNANNNGTINAQRDMGASLIASSASIVGATTAAQALAPVAASLGLKAIPGVASVVAAGETIYNTTDYALKGEWAKAGLSLVSGAGETVAGLGGVFTYATIGTAWREAVRSGGAALLGEENTIEHSNVVKLGSWLKEQFYDATNPEEKPAYAPVLAKRNSPAFAPAL